MRRRTTVLLLGGMLAAPPTVRAQGVPPLRLGAGPVDVAVPLVYAAKSGLYKKYGLNVEIVKLSNGPSIASAVAGGAIELGQAATLSVVQAHAKGLPFTVIGNLSYYDASKPDQGLFVLASSPLRAPKDLEGKTVATVSVEGMPALVTSAWLDARGVDRSTVKYVEMPAAAMLAALEQNRIDAAVLYEPFFTANLNSGKVRVFGYVYDAIAKRFSSAVIFGQEKWVSEHRDVVDRFIRASQEAAVYVSAHESESTQLIAEFAGVDAGAVANVRHGGRGIILNPGEIQPVIDAAAKYGFIAKAFPAQEMICSCAHRR
jgi:NitT/TauT family transport system substrate-binding protein